MVEADAILGEVPFLVAKAAAVVADLVVVETASVVSQADV